MDYRLFEDIVPRFVTDYKGRVWELNQEQYKLHIDHLCLLGKKALANA
jgi:hypothetical protein